MYDDQPDSFDMAIAAAGECATQVKKGKILKGSSVAGWSIAEGRIHHEQITITQGYKRQWWAVVVNCDLNTNTASPVSLADFEIVAGTSAVPCSTMGQYSVAGYNWAIVLMTLALIAAAVLAFLFWNKSKSWSMSTTVNTFEMSSRR